VKERKWIEHSGSIFWGVWAAIVRGVLHMGLFNCEE